MMSPMMLALGDGSSKLKRWRLMMVLAPGCAIAAIATSLRPTEPMSGLSSIRIVWFMGLSAWLWTTDCRSGYGCVFDNLILLSHQKIWTAPGSAST